MTDTDQAADLNRFSSVVEAVQRLPENERFGDVKLDLENRIEDAVEKVGLDPQRNWIHLGFVYALVGIQTSLLDAWKAANGEELHLETVQTARPIADMIGTEFNGSPWAHLLQGSGIALDGLIGYLGTLRFIRREAGREYRIGFQQVEISDPVGDPTKLIRVLYCLPISIDITTRKARGISFQSPGLVPGRPPMFCMIDMGLMA